VEKVATPLFPSTVAFPPDEENLTQWVASLSQNHLLVLSSYDRDVLLSAGKQIAAATDFSPCETFLLSFRVVSSRAVPSRLGQLFDRDDYSKTVLLVVEASDSKASRFLDRVIGDPSAVDTAKEELKDDWLILLTNDSVLGWQAYRETSLSRNQRLPYHCVPFLAQRLRTELPGEPDRLKVLVSEIEEQRKRGRWGDGEEQFYDLVLRSIAHKVLFDEIEKRRDGSQGLATRKPADGATPTQSKPLSVASSSDSNNSLPAAPSESEGIKLSRLLSPSTPLDNTVLFVATFFPDLSLADFERLLLILLGDRVQTDTTGEVVLGSDGSGRIEEKRTTRPLSEIWAETYPEVLVRCRLTATSSTIDFSLPDMREGLRNTFSGLHHPIYASLVREVRERGLLFDESQAIVDATVRLFVDEALGSPRSFSGSRLGVVIPEAGTPLIVDRLYFVLRAFLQRPTLRDNVLGFLGDLFREKRFGDIIDLVWALWDVPELTPLNWVRRLFEEGTEEARRRTYARLWHSGRSGRGLQIVVALAEWLPAPKAYHPSQSGLAALDFIIELYRVSLYDPERRRSGWPPSHPLLAAAGPTDGSTPESRAIRCLLHAAVASILTQNFQESLTYWIYWWLIPPALHTVAFDESRPAALWENLEVHWDSAKSDPLLGDGRPIEPLFFPAAVWADWAVELLSAQPVHPRSIALYDRVIASLVQECDAPRRGVLGILWANFEECLLDVQVLLEELDPLPADLDHATVLAIRKDLQTRRRCIKQLRLDLKTRSRSVATAR